MARKASTRIAVETMRFSPVGHVPVLLWEEIKDGFKSIPEAEAWVRDNIIIGQKLRVIKISGVFNAKTTVTKR